MLRHRTSARDRDLRPTHTRSVEAHKITPDDQLYGLKKSTQLRQNGKAKRSVV